MSTHISKAFYSFYLFILFLILSYYAHDDLLHGRGVSVWSSHSPHNCRATTPPTFRDWLSNSVKKSEEFFSKIFFLLLLRIRLLTLNYLLDLKTNLKWLRPLNSVVFDYRLLFAIVCFMFTDKSRFIDIVRH